MSEAEVWSTSEWSRRKIEVKVSYMIIFKTLGLEIAVKVSFVNRGHDT
jgi:hypothetical protein